MILTHRKGTWQDPSDGSIILCQDISKRSFWKAKVMAQRLGVSHFPHPAMWSRRQYTCMIVLCWAFLDSDSHWLVYHTCNPGDISTCQTGIFPYSCPPLTQLKSYEGGGNMHNLEQRPFSEVLAKYLCIAGAVYKTRHAGKKTSQYFCHTKERQTHKTRH